MPIKKTMKWLESFDWTEFGETIWDIVKIMFAIVCTLGVIDLFLGVLNEVVKK